MTWQKLAGKLSFKTLYYSQLGIRNKVNFWMLSYKQICVTMFERRQSETCIIKTSSSTVYLAHKRQLIAICWLKEPISVECWYLILLQPWQLISPKDHWFEFLSICWLHWFGIIPPTALGQATISPKHPATATQLASSLPLLPLSNPFSTVFNAANHV